MKNKGSRAMSKYLMYRYVYDAERIEDTYPCRIQDIEFPRISVKSASDLLRALEYSVSAATKDGKAAIALSGGIDSAILAKFMPKGSTAYTFRCIVPGVKVIDETEKAKEYAKICGLNHYIVDVRWDDIESVVDELMMHKGAPIHSIEAQIYIAAKRAVRDGFDKFIFGENADIIYGGMDGLLAKDWLFGEFIERYTYVKPYQVLRDAELPLEPYLEFEEDGHIDGHKFINKYFRQEALGTYHNACETAGIEFIGPYSVTVWDSPIDYNRIRRGDTKYIVRETFRKLYPALSIPEKIPMPRAMNEWLKDWKGPTRTEFFPHCTDRMTGDQKWMVWALERYLDIAKKDGKYAHCSY